MSHKFRGRAWKADHQNWDSPGSQRREEHHPTLHSVIIWIHKICKIFEVLSICWWWVPRRSISGLWTPPADQSNYNLKPRKFEMFFWKESDLDLAILLYTTYPFERQQSRGIVRHCASCWFIHSRKTPLYRLERQLQEVQYSLEATGCFKRKSHPLNELENKTTKVSWKAPE